ncbi:hypothetical protein THAOC_15937 [Thalassiosira oceanica]|uniref:Uncharacterized protein n=1 Tax=Thalassiosira oceanica TaxID=159749 RepID=K0SQR2_THAOC|nr:hypothetical protein THAOC_15937 [Thalassiosira oceanica]|eukprot:EJK63401.1 hypothetical protein THAOC_15937 [Thalassiosira oceanica]
MIPFCNQFFPGTFCASRAVGGANHNNHNHCQLSRQYRGQAGAVIGVAAGGEFDKDLARQDDRQNGQNRPRSTRRVSLSLPAIIIASSLVVCLVLIAKQLHAYVLEYQGPSDHVASSILTPFYGMMCPRLLDKPSRQTYWNCGELDIAEAVEFPRIFMIGARGKDEDTYESWREALDTSQNAPYFERINTLEVSNRFALQGGMLAEEQGDSSNAKQLCRKMKWEQRLFYVYQTVFQDVLSTYPSRGQKNTGFVFVEDDSILNEQEVPLFKTEICEAQADARSFYSLYRSPLQRGLSSCIYRHGTVAFYIRRGLMEIIANERRREHVCRFPIDMYISRLGPWYAPRQEIVMHSGAARVGSTS